MDNGNFILLLPSHRILLFTFSSLDTMGCTYSDVSAFFIVSTYCYDLTIYNIFVIHLFRVNFKESYVNIQAKLSAKYTGQGVSKEDNTKRFQSNYKVGT